MPSAFLLAPYKFMCSAFKSNNSYIKVLSFLSLITSCSVLADPKISAGLWFNYSYLPGEATNSDTMGSLGDEAFIVYIDDADTSGDKNRGERRWQYSAEIRFGPGSFTDRDNNSSGDNFAIHKAWAKYAFADGLSLTAGKSAVPFGWKTTNFWPGDMLLGGYGDQMDVGLAFGDQRFLVDYKLAYLLADDWGTRSTDSLDDNGHWGSSNTYRKLNTLVTDAQLPVGTTHIIGFSAQHGELQDLSESADGGDTTTGDHQAWVAYYKGKHENAYLNLQWLKANRSLPSQYRKGANLGKEIKSDRAALTIGYQHKRWNVYLDASYAKQMSGADRQKGSAIAPGFSYQYGAGWIYVEYLNQNGFIDRNGGIKAGSFDALYVSADYYF